MEIISKLWDRAKQSLSGICIQTDNPTALFDALIRYRFDMADPELFGFTIVIRGKNVWIVRSDTGAVRTDGDYAPLEE